MEARVRSKVLKKVPDVTPSGKPGNDGTAVATPAFAPGGVQQWMCAAVVPLGAPVAVVVSKPLKVALTVMVLPSTVTTALPVPGELTAGTSFAPDSVVVNTRMSALTGTDKAVRAIAAANAKRVTPQ